MSASRISLLVLIAFGAGIVLGRWVSEDQVAPVPNSQAPLPTKTTRREATQGLPPSIQKLLEPVRTARSDDERMRATLALATSIPVDQLEQWYTSGWFGLHESMDSLVFERVTQDRWLEKDPAGLIAFLMKSERPEWGLMASRWAGHDATGAFAFLRSSAHPGELRDLFMAMMDGLAKGIPQTVADEMPWILETFGNDFAVAAMLAQMVEFHPELVSSRLQGWPEPLRRDATVALDQAAFEKDFPSALSALVSAPDGKARFMKAFGDRPWLAGDLLDHLESLPAGWFADALAGKALMGAWKNSPKWLEVDLVAAGLPESEAKDIRTRAIWGWSSDQPEEAFRRLSQSSLSAEERGTLIEACSAALLKLSPERAEALVAQLSDPDEIALARRAIERAQTQKTMEQVKSIPEWLASFSNDAAHADESVAAVWDSRQAVEAVAAFDRLPPGEKERIAGNLIDEANSEIPSELAAAALSHLLIHPYEEKLSREDLEDHISEFTSEWGSRDPGATGRWVATLPEGDTRLWAAKNLVARWADYEPAAARAWASSLPPGERGEVLDYLESGAGWKETEE